MVFLYIKLKERHRHSLYLLKPPQARRARQQPQPLNSPLPLHSHHLECLALTSPPWLHSLHSLLRLQPNQQKKRILMETSLSVWLTPSSRSAITMSSFRSGQVKIQLTNQISQEGWIKYSCFWFHAIQIAKKNLNGVAVYIIIVLILIMLFCWITDMCFF